MKYTLKLRNTPYIRQKVSFTHHGGSPYESIMSNIDMGYSEKDKSSFHCYSQKNDKNDSFSYILMVLDHEHNLHI